MSSNLTLGGFHPGVPLWLLPGHAQLWWKPCLTRGEAGDTHCWYLGPTSDGSLYCHVCRIGKPRVYVGPKVRVAAIRSAINDGDLALAQRLAFDNSPLPAIAEAQFLWRPAYRDQSDWFEWWKERASIYEFLGGMDRSAAERAATDLAGAWTV